MTSQTPLKSFLHSLCPHKKIVRLLESLKTPPLGGFNVSMKSFWTLRRMPWSGRLDDEMKPTSETIVETTSQNSDLDE